MRICDFLQREVQLDQRSCQLYDWTAMNKDTIGVPTAAVVVLIGLKPAVMRVMCLT